MLEFKVNKKVKLLLCFAFEQIFDDADKSELSCIIVDDIERLLGMTTAVFCGNLSKDVSLTGNVVSFVLNNSL